MDETEKHGHKKIKLCVSGAAETGHCGPDAMDKAKELGFDKLATGHYARLGREIPISNFQWLGRLGRHPGPWPRD